MKTNINKFLGSLLLGMFILCSQNSLWIDITFSCAPGCEHNGVCDLDCGPDPAPPSNSDAITNMKFDTCKNLPGTAGCPTPTSTPSDITNFAGKAIGIMLQLVASIGIAVAVYGGFRMITSQGNDTGIKKGTSAFTQAIIGIVIVLLAYVMISFIQGLIVH